MADYKTGEAPASPHPTYLRLRPWQIEKVFNECAFDLHRILVLDGIDMLPDEFRVRSHGLYGPLPEILFKNSVDMFRDKELLGYQICKLTAVVKLREEMIRFFPGAKFLPPTSLDGRAVVGIRSRPKTWFAEGENSLKAYQKLHSRIVG